ncbi:hypothetical protein NO263_02170 [Gluconacetobacter entanii]|uniref:Uncharacterized protein n=1 Tax=Gluconacetobacter entanii TaxID=108528 RepID=A0ABT3K1W5_9PROT|nr:hypothetical protein [Gluconacetobacter entanii]MCW4589393.1 hypothetical protein [Gluconacetobacter entanii]MCW4592796.1 hypothetical protein [Gluconacetobacter entanii]NPC87628.1 hypothetical protein [Gluconacetobacter entanii]
MKNIQNKYYIFFLIFSIYIGTSTHSYGQATSSPTKSSCVHWTKTVDLDGLDETAMGLEPDGYYCEKPDKIIVDKHHASVSGSGQGGGNYRSGRGYGRHAYGGHSRRR